MKKLAACVATFAIVIGALVVSNRPNTPPLPEPPSANVQPVLPNGPLPPTPQVKPVSFRDALNLVKRDELKELLYWFCSAENEGRMSGKKGNVASRDYIVRYYTALGLKPGVPNFIQTFGIERLNNQKEAGEASTSNVIATLLPNDQGVAHETIVIGAHFDHVGYGPSMSRTPNRREIHPGADDNASGTTVLLGAAKILAAMKGQNRRRIVFVSFSAEEMGLIGAKYYVSNNPFPQTIFMLNMDMVGRLKGKQTIDALGGGSSPEIKDILNKIQGYPFRPNITSGAGGGSDHLPFFQRSIPVCFLHTGMHNDYHTPEDTADKIDYDGLLQVTRYVAHIVWEVDKLPAKPRFQGAITDELDFDDHDWKKTWK